MTEIESTARIKPPLNSLLDASVAIEAANASMAQSVQFMARVFVQVTLPHSKPQSNEVERSNGSVRVSMMAPARIGLPYGSIPRLVLAWVSTEATRTRSRDLCLGTSFADFMSKVGLVTAGRSPTGGKTGSLRRVKDQCRRLFATTITCMTGSDGHTADRRFVLSDEVELWWEPISPDQKTLFKSTVRLSETFFQEIVRAPVPIDLRALRALKRSPLALDLYMWLTHRVFRLRAPATIPWPSLQRQFGAGYPETARGRADFRVKFQRALRKVELVYRAVRGRVILGDGHLTLLPASSHVHRLGA
jgi:hypothetical protein